VPARRTEAPPGAPRPCRRQVGIVAAYLSSLADSGRKSSTIRRKPAAIGCRHKLAGHEPPTSAEGVRATLRGIRRTIGAAAQGKTPAAADVLTARLTLCPATLASHRDQGTPRPRLCRTPGAIVAFASLARPAGAIAFRQLLIVSVPLPRMSAPLMNAQMRAAPLAHQCQARRPIQT
jgi:hypothetical protein